MYRVDRTATLSDAETRVGNISRYLLGFCIQSDVMVHFQHDFKLCGALSCFIHERLTYLFIVCQAMFTLGKSQSISQTTERERQGKRQRFIQQVAGNPRWGRFTIETPLQRERGLEIQREQQRR